MQRSLIIAAALASFGASAFAQSTVNVYGRLNLTIERQKSGNGPNDWVMQNNSSRFGLRGSEDLGGGLKAGFEIEHGFNPATGAQSQTNFWARQSEVRLSGGFGMVRLGNFTSEAYYATADYVGMHNHDTGTSSDALYTYLGRDTNKIAYRTPSIGGAKFEVAITEAGANPDRTIDLAANWDSGPLQLGAGYQKDGSNNQFAVRGLYEMGALTFGGYVQRADLDVVGRRTAFRLAAAYAIGNTSLHADFGSAGDYSNVNNSGAKQFTLGANYNLSKRTKVYTFYTKLDSDIASNDFSSVAVGVRHNF